MSRSRASGTQIWPESIVWTEVFMISTTVASRASKVPRASRHWSVNVSPLARPVILAMRSPMRTGISSPARGAARTDVGRLTAVWPGSMPLTRTVNSRPPG